MAVERYKESLLWKAAEGLRREAEEMTRGLSEYHTLLRLLREKTAALPGAVAAV
jgi:hypothetical protein